MTDRERGEFLALYYVVLMLLPSDHRGTSILKSIREILDPTVKELEPSDTYAGFDSRMKRFEDVIKATQEKMGEKGLV